MHTRSCSFRPLLLMRIPSLPTCVAVASHTQAYCTQTPHSHGVHAHVCARPRPAALMPKLRFPVLACSLPLMPSPCLPTCISHARTCAVSLRTCGRRHGGPGAQLCCACRLRLSAAAAAGVSHRCHPRQEKDCSYSGESLIFLAASLRTLACARRGPLCLEQGACEPSLLPPGPAASLGET